MNHPGLPNPDPTLDTFAAVDTTLSGGLWFRLSTLDASRTVTYHTPFTHKGGDVLTVDSPLGYVSAVSNPMPPAPIMATLLPTGFLHNNSISTLGWSMPSISGLSGNTRCNNYLIEISFVKLFCWYIGIQDVHIVKFQLLFEVAQGFVELLLPGICCNVKFITYFLSPIKQCDFDLAKRLW